MIVSLSPHTSVQFSSFRDGLSLVVCFTGISSTISPFCTRPPVIPILLNSVRCLFLLLTASALSLWLEAGITRSVQVTLGVFLALSMVVLECIVWLARHTSPLPHIYSTTFFYFVFFIFPTLYSHSHAQITCTLLTYNRPLRPPSSLYFLYFLHNSTNFAKRKSTVYEIFILRSRHRSDLDNHCTDRRTLHLDTLITKRIEKCETDSQCDFERRFLRFSFRISPRHILLKLELTYLLYSA